MIPDSVEIIEKEAFRDCVRLKRVELGKGIKKVDVDALSGT